MRLAVSNFLLVSTGMKDLVKCVLTVIGLVTKFTFPKFESLKVWSLEARIPVLISPNWPDDEAKVDVSAGKYAVSNVDPVGWVEAELEGGGDAVGVKAFIAISYFWDIIEYTYL